MQSTNQPPKFLIPFAQNDAAKVEIPATTTDPARFSQSLGSPPATGMPPEAGGVPPQLEDFNGALYQQSRIGWWLMAGGRFGYDSTWANDTLIGGYAAGAVLPSADKAGEWYNTNDNNVADPDSNGANWVPGYHYGAYALTGLTGGTINLFPSSAAKQVLTLAGTLTANQVLVMPNWLYDWVVYNNTSGAFSVTVKTAAGTGAVIPQNGAPTPIRGDGTNISLLSANIAPATSASQAARFDQTGGRLLRTSFYGRNTGGTQTVVVDGAAPTTTGAGTFTPLAATQRVRVRMVGGGGGGGTAALTASNSNSCGGGGGAAAYAESILPIATIGAAQTVTVGAAGTPVAQGGTSSVGALVTAEGGVPGQSGAASSTWPILRTGGGGGAAALSNVYTGYGQQGLPGQALALTLAVSGAGAPSVFGGGGGGTFGTGAGNTTITPGAGGAGGVAGASAAAQLGGNGGPGCVIIEEYA